jgi:Subtilase family
MKKHLFLKNSSKAERFTNPQEGGPKFVLPDRDRSLHSQNLLLQISAIRENAPEAEHLLPFQNGHYAEIKSEPKFPLNLKSIEADGRELVAVKTVDNTEIATVFLNATKLTKLEEKIKKYQTEDSVRLKKDGTESRNAKNKTLVESISEINLASIRSLWTDNISFPNENELIRWEVWLRVGENDAERERILEFFRNAAESARIQTSSKEIRFPESTVVLVQATATQISQILYPLNILSELRKVVDTADFFIGLGRDDEREWSHDAVKRIQPPSNEAPAVCLLDTGVNYEHPLLKLAMNPNEMDAYDRQQWLITDHYPQDGHGTPMAGLSLYGDLTEILASSEQHTLQHKIESVKIVPPKGKNPEELYGSITTECVSRAEIFAPTRKRVFCLAITAPDNRTQGSPSSWSASIDAITSASIEETGDSRLFFIAAGNANQNTYEFYPTSNHGDEIHDPAQSLNAITVGAYTDKVVIPEISPDFGKTPLAPHGGLSPHSTTGSLNKWANKPDIVLEGGNYLLSDSEQPPALQLLSTNKNWLLKRYLTTFEATSAATALASRIAALIIAEYPNLRAETIRGLVIHSANWTKEMLTKSPNKKELLRCFGYGVPNLENALYSANNSVTLIAEDKLQPYLKEGGTVKINEMNLYELPWATDVLLGLGESEVEMRVTLSYFIEPNPNGKGYKDKHRYVSYQLRFDTKKSTESISEFTKRINKAAREENEKPELTGGDSKEWDIGFDLRHKGSVHSDIWKGTAADLATKNVIAVYPVGGWWKDLKRQKKWDKIANYSLIVSIKTQETEIDLYTPIQNQIMIPIEV